MSPDQLEELRRIVARLAERRRELTGFSVVVSVDDSETYIAALREQIIRKSGSARMAIKYHNAVIGDFSTVEFRADDRVCDMIICTRTAFNHCEVLHVSAVEPQSALGKNQHE